MCVCIYTRVGQTYNVYYTLRHHLIFVWLSESERNRHEKETRLDLLKIIMLRLLVKRNREKRNCDRER